MQRDFTLTRKGAEATLETHNWGATQWLRENAPDVTGVVVGGVYATVHGTAKALDALAGRMEAGGLVRSAD